MSLKLNKILLVLLLIQVPSEGIGNKHETFLNQLLKIVHHERSVETLFLLYHTKELNCSLQNWNPEKVPTLRLNELTDVNFEKSFNHNALGVVCVTEYSYEVLLKTLSKAFETIRQERIILLIHRRPNPDVMQDISYQVKGLQFINLLVLITEEQSFTDLIAPGFRLQPFPEPHFKKVRNLFASKDIFPHPANYHGRLANAIPNEMYTTYGPGSRIISEFAKKYNITLRLQWPPHQNTTGITYEDTYDLNMNLRLFDRKNSLDYINVVTTVSTNCLIVVVPCGMELNGMDIFKELGLGTLTWSALIFFIIFTAVESVFIYISNRINGTNFIMRFTSPLVSLRAFRAIMGQSFPVSNRSSRSIQLLLCLMSLFGTLFGSFFACKLSSFLTKKPYYPQVETFPELRESGLTVFVDGFTREYIEREINGDFFKQEVPNVRTMSTLKLINLLQSVKIRAGFLVHSLPWGAFKKATEKLNHRVYCEGKNLTIVENVPMMIALRRNSIFSRQMRNFILNMAVSGLDKQWFKKYAHKVKADIKLSLQGFKMDQSHIPLSLDHFKWLWILLGIAYIISFVVFVIEICWARTHKRIRRNNHTIC